MNSQSHKWNFAPLYEPDQEVFWIEEKIKNGIVKGIAFEKSLHDGMDREQTVYFIAVGTEAAVRVFEIPEGRLFESRELALIYVENN